MGVTGVKVEEYQLVPPVPGALSSQMSWLRWLGSATAGTGGGCVLTGTGPANASCSNSHTGTLSAASSVAAAAASVVGSTRLLPQ